MKLKPLFKNKRGDLPSLIYLLVILFVIGVVGIIVASFLGDFYDELKATPELNMSNNTLDAFNTIQNGSNTWLDFLFFFSLIAMAVGLFISAIYIDTSPAITMVFLFLLVVTIFLAGIFSNVFAEITDQSELVATTQQFTFTRTIMPILPLIILGLGIIIIAILYGKPRTPGGF